MLLCLGLSCGLLIFLFCWVDLLCGYANSLFCWLGSSCRLVHFHYVLVVVLGKIHHQKAGNLNSLLVTCQNDSLSPVVVAGRNYTQ